MDHKNTLSGGPSGQAGAEPSGNCETSFFRFARNSAKAREIYQIWITNGQRIELYSLHTNEVCTGRGGVPPFFREKIGGTMKRRKKKQRQLLFIDLNPRTALPQDHGRHQSQFRRSPSWQRRHSSPPWCSNENQPCARKSELSGI